MNTDSFFCKNYTNIKQIHKIIDQAYQAAAVFKGSIKYRRINIPALTLTKLSQDHLFFSCNTQPDLILSSGTELTVLFHVPLDDSTLPCECSVTVVTFTQKDNKLFIVTLFPYSISLLQRREQVRYPIAEENFAFYSLFFTNTQVVNEKEWQPINSGAVKYNEISAGGLSFVINTDETAYVPTNRSVLILKCKFPPQLPPDPIKKELCSFILIAKIFRLSQKGNEILIRAKFSHWCYNAANKRWNIVQAHTGISQILPYITPPENSLREKNS